MTELLEKRIKEISEAVANGIVVQSDAQFLLQMLIQASESVVSLKDQLDLRDELLADLNAVLKTAMHNGHHDLIQRVADVCKIEGG